MKHKKLTAAQRKRILTACELVETRGCYSCLSLQHGYDTRRFMYDYPEEMYGLAQRYADLYDRSPHVSWEFDDRFSKEGRTMKRPRPKFVPYATKQEICVAAGRRGGLKRGNFKLPRVVTTLASVKKGQAHEPQDR